MATTEPARPAAMVNLEMKTNLFYPFRSTGHTESHKVGMYNIRLGFFFFSWTIFLDILRKYLKLRKSSTQHFATELQVIEIWWMKKKAKIKFQIVDFEQLLITLFEK